MSTEVQEGQVEKEARGSAYIELRLSGRWALSALTEGWKPEEIAALKAGDPEAKATLEEALSQRVLASPDECERDIFELVISDV